MKEFALRRVHEGEEDFIKKMAKIIESMEDFLQAPFEFDSKVWDAQFWRLLDHQSADGSFRVIDTTKVHFDPAFDFIVQPTIVGTSVLMKSILLNPEYLKGFVLERIELALGVFCKNLYCIRSCRRS